jgi:hypothetical protein
MLVWQNHLELTYSHCAATHIISYSLVARNRTRRDSARPSAHHCRAQRPEAMCGSEIIVERIGRASKHHVFRLRPVLVRTSAPHTHNYARRIFITFFHAAFPFSILVAVRSCSGHPTTEFQSTFRCLSRSSSQSRPPLPSLSLSLRRRPRRPKPQSFPSLAAPAATVKQSHRHPKK